MQCLVYQYFGVFCLFPILTMVEKRNIYVLVFYICIAVIYICIGSCCIENYLYFVNLHFCIGM